MNVFRTILILAIGLATVVSSAPATPTFGSGDKTPVHPCCNPAKHSDSNRDDSSGKPCHDTTCAMQCCRLLPVQADTKPILEQTFQVVRAEPLPLVALHSLTDPEAIFHPPKA